MGMRWVVEETRVSYENANFWIDRKITVRFGQKAFVKNH